MKPHLYLRLLVLNVVFLTCSAWSALLTFDDLPAFTGDDPFGRSDFGELHRLAGGSYGGVSWDAGWWVAGDQLIAHNDPSDMFNEPNTSFFAHPRSPHWAIFNGFADSGWGFDTTMYLTGLWLSQGALETEPGGATNVTVVALSGANELGSVSLDLTSSEPVFLDTSAFLFLSGITRYRIDSRGPGPGGKGFFVADDFQFAPASLADVCPCDGSWGNHAQFVRCVRRAVVRLVRNDALTRRQARNLLRAAVESDCGH